MMTFINEIQKIENLTQEEIIEKYNNQIKDEDFFSIFPYSKIYNYKGIDYQIFLIMNFVNIDGLKLSDIKSVGLKFNNDKLTKSINDFNRFYSINCHIETNDLNNNEFVNEFEKMVKTAHIKIDKLNDDLINQIENKISNLNELKKIINKKENK